MMVPEYRIREMICSGTTNGFYFPGRLELWSGLRIMYPGGETAFMQEEAP